jgi:hypothetical protein
MQRYSLGSTFRKEFLGFGRFVAFEIFCADSFPKVNGSQKHFYASAVYIDRVIARVAEVSRAPRYRREMSCSRTELLKI